MIATGGAAAATAAGVAAAANAAGVAAGCLDANEVVDSLVDQARLLTSSELRGGMVAVLAQLDLFDREPIFRDTELAGINYGDHFVVSGPPAAIGALTGWLRSDAASKAAIKELLGSGCWPVAGMHAGC